MDVCAGLGVETVRVEGRTGVWLAADADAPRAQGRAPSACASPRASRCTASPSTATPTWRRFDRIVPCGITDADVTSLTVETGPRARRSPSSSTPSLARAPAPPRLVADVLHARSRRRARVTRDSARQPYRPGRR